MTSRSLIILLTHNRPKILKRCISSAIKHSKIASDVYWIVTVGHDSIIGGNAPDRTIIGNRVRHFGRIVHAQRDRSGGWDATEEPSPVICDGVLIGANAIIIGGIEIGKDSVIAANEVVKENVPEKSIFSHGKIKPIK